MIAARTARTLGVLALIVGPMLQSGCGWFEDQRPEEVTVFVTGDDGVQVNVLTSTRFVAAQTETGQTRVELLGADTLTVTIPWSASYNIAGDYRFFIQVSNIDAVDPLVNTQVLLDGQEKYDDGGILRDHPLRFLYMFNQKFGAVIEVL